KLLNLPEGSNASKTGPDGASLPFRIFSGGREIQSDDLPMHRSARLGVTIRGEEFDVVFDGGTTKTLLASVSPLFDERGEVRGCVGIYDDITERKQADRQKNLFIDELNHRVKNTLAIVQSIAAQTLRQTAEPKAFNEA